jgi:hypothetical protein
MSNCGLRRQVSSDCNANKGTSSDSFSLGTSVNFANEARFDADGHHFADVFTEAWPTDQLPNGLGLNFPRGPLIRLFF